MTNLLKPVSLILLASGFLAACSDNAFVADCRTVNDFRGETEEVGDCRSEGEILDSTFDDITVSRGNLSGLVPGRSLLEVIDVDIGTTDITEALPDGLVQIGDGIRLSISEADQELLNGPAAVTVDYGNLDVQDENALVVLYFDGANYQPVTILSQDSAADTLTFESRRFDTFVLAENTVAPPAAFDTGFSPASHGWSIENSGSYFAPGGNSFAMAGFAAWFFANSEEMLATTYVADTALRAAARVQIAQGETWGAQDWRRSHALPDDRLDGLLRHHLSARSAPVVLLLGENNPELAVLAYAYDANGFSIYDPRFPAQAGQVSFGSGSFGQYDGLNVLGYAQLASFGRQSDFMALAAEAANGFPGSELMMIDAPMQGESIDTRETNFTGSFADDLSAETQFYAEVKGIGRQLAVSGGNFDNVIEVSSGINTIVALAGVDGSSQNNWFKDAPTVVRDIFGDLPPAALLATLTWAQDEIDVDLYIIEPDGKAMWFGNRETGNGLELDFDDVDGFGPEHGTLEQATLGNETSDEVLDGEYSVRVHYFSDDGLNVRATGQVTIIINEGQDNQGIIRLRFAIDEDNAGTSGPDGEGAAWVDLVKIDLVEGTFSQDFSEDNADDEQ